MNASLSTVKTNKRHRRLIGFLLGSLAVVCIVLASIGANLCCGITATERQVYQVVLGHRFDALDESYAKPLSPRVRIESRCFSSITSPYSQSALKEIRPRYGKDPDEGILLKVRRIRWYGDYAEVSVVEMDHGRFTAVYVYLLANVEGDWTIQAVGNPVII
jgi:hypothetical protein